MKPVNRLRQIECRDFTALPSSELLTYVAQRSAKLDFVRRPGQLPKRPIDPSWNLTHTSVAAEAWQERIRVTLLSAKHSSELFIGQDRGNLEGQ